MKLNLSKDTVKKLEKVNPCQKGNISQASDNGPISRIYAGLPKLSHQESSPIKTWAKCLNTHFSEGGE